MEDTIVRIGALTFKEFTKNLGNGIIKYGPAIFTCCASVLAVTKESIKQDRLAEKIADAVVRNLKTR